MEIINQIKLKLKKFIRKKVDKSTHQPIKIVQQGDKFYLILKNINPPHSYIFAKSSDGFNFNLVEQSIKLENFVEKLKNAYLVPNFTLKDKKIAFFGDRHIYLARSSKKNNWIKTNKQLIISPYPQEPGGAFLFPKGIVVLYFEKTVDKGITYYKAHIAEFDKKLPSRLLWKTTNPIWNSGDHWQEKKAVFLGSAMLKDKIVMYWYVDEEIIYGVYLTSFLSGPQTLYKPQAKLKKYSKNPIIHPRIENKWESFNTLNPAAVYLDKRVHILYRAQGFDYISTFGYAVSSDGINIDRRLDYPVYGPRVVFETNLSGRVNPDLVSAGGFGGCEDPRITLIDGRVYLVYVAFDGWSNLRLALTSIDVHDFLNHRWNWEQPVLISPPHVIDKSGCLLPEKIKGKYVFFHRVFPDILIDYVDDLNFSSKKRWLLGEHKIKVRPNMWDSRKIGAGAPPLKTPEGWLLIYYGVNDKDASKYHIGAMLLELNNPTHVLHRSNQPILSPSEVYENNGFKPGIAYPCGAVIIKDKLFVYYGAADSTVCVAQANLDNFLKELKSDHLPHLSSIKIKEVTY